MKRKNLNLVDLTGADLFAGGFSMDILMENLLNKVWKLEMRCLQE